MVSYRIENLTETFEINNHKVELKASYHPAFNHCTGYLIIPLDVLNIEVNPSIHTDEANEIFPLTSSKINFVCIINNKIHLGIDQYIKPENYTHQNLEEMMSKLKTWGELTKPLIKGE